VRDRKGDKEFYRILRELECRLQELGVRSDFGVPTEPTFAVETLCSAIHYVTSLENAKDGLLLEVSHDMYLVDKERREKREVVR
jgi:hypothetical protein